MSDDAQAQKPVQQKTPVELLFDQTQSLSDLVEIQKNQSSQIAELKQQNERLVTLLADKQKESPETGLTRVKIENINMPFGALVGFMIKISLASIPAAIILAIIYGLIALAFGGILGGVFGGIFNSFR